MEGKITITAYKETGVTVEATLNCTDDLDIYYLKDVIRTLLETKKEAKN